MYFFQNLRNNWNSQEDIYLLEKSIRLKMKWSEIAKKMSGRTQHSVKNRVVYLMKKTLDMSREKIREKIKNKEATNFAILTLDSLKKF